MHMRAPNIKRQPIAPVCAQPQCSPLIISSSGKTFTPSPGFRVMERISKLGKLTALSRRSWGWRADSCNFCRPQQRQASLVSPVKLLF